MLAESKREEPRLQVEVHFVPDASSTLPRDVERGLSNQQKSLPPKYFYDDRGSELFDRICSTDEYYPTRTEMKLLENVSEEVLQHVKPTSIVELGSGAARKTRALLDAASRLGEAPRYVPFDVSEGMLRDSAEQLLEEYPWLEVYGIVGDYDHHLSKLPDGKRRLFLFIGSTIGNFEPASARDFVRKIASEMNPGDYFLLGTDLVKDRSVLRRAYNDDSGITAEFNGNVLHVINRELDANFDVQQFEHVAFFNEAQSQIEMHLRSTAEQQVEIEKLGLTVDFEEGETIRTEISRKFTRERVVSLLESAGLELVRWYTPDNDYFALSLARLAR